MGKGDRIKKMEQEVQAKKVKMMEDFFRLAFTAEECKFQGGINMLYSEKKLRGGMFKIKLKTGREFYIAEMVDVEGMELTSAEEKK